MQHLDEGTIHSWLDGALSSSEAARAEAHIASCTACAEAVAEARGLIAASSRILLALDEVPNVKGAGGAGGAGGARGAARRVSLWLVRERIAAVVAMIVAGGALAVALSREGRQASVVQLTSEEAHPVAVTVADSPTAPPAVMADARKEASTAGNVSGRGAAASKAPARDVASAMAAPQASQVTFDTTARVVTRGVAAASRTDDTLRPIEVAEAQRAEARDAENQAKSTVADRIRGLAQRRAAAEEPARYAEVGAARASGGRVAGADGSPRLVHEERMTESGREVRRRIYQVEDVLVTLDEQLPTAVDLMREAAPSPAPAAPPAQSDSASSSTTTLQWTDARGARLTLTGSAPREKLEQIRKLLGY